VQTRPLIPRVFVSWCLGGEGYVSARRPVEADGLRDGARVCRRFPI